MKVFVPLLAARTLAGASARALAAVTEADMLGAAAQASAAQRTVVIGPKTLWVTVEKGEVVRFVSNGREFAWTFNGMSSTLDLKRIAPEGALDRRVMVYVWPNAQDISDNG